MLEEKEQEEKCGRVMCVCLRVLAHLDQCTVFLAFVVQTHTSPVLVSRLGTSLFLPLSLFKAVLAFWGVCVCVFGIRTWCLAWMDEVAHPIQISYSCRNLGRVETTHTPHTKVTLFFRNCFETLSDNQDL